MVAICAAIVALSMGQAFAPLREEPRQPQSVRSPQEQPQSSPGASAPQKPSPSTSGFDEHMIERIRRRLELAPGLTLARRPTPDTPTYRVDVFGYRFRAPEWRFQVALPPSSVPQPIGGADYYELMRLITPPEFWGSAGMSNRDVLDLLITGTETWAGRMAVKKAVKTYRKGTINRARDDVRRELAEVAAHNARAAGESAAKPAVKKKQEAGKK